MAGGSGTRFWPISTIKVPKQFQPVEGTGKTFIQLTKSRFEGLVRTFDDLELFRNFRGADGPETGSAAACHYYAPDIVAKHKLKYTRQECTGLNIHRHFHSRRQ